jgi:(p)ppGpp synthase/HD superfamily hydrolase
MTPEEERNLALSVAYNAHKTQYDKSGKPYILHPLRVALSFDELELQTVSLLHDVVEDTVVSLDNLNAMGFSSQTIAAVDAISRREGEKYADYVERVCGNLLACFVKLEDLTDNMSPARREGVNESMMKRYEQTREKITQHLQQWEIKRS